MMKSKKNRNQLLFDKCWDAQLSCQSFAISLVNDLDECVTRNEVSDICGSPSFLGVHVKIAVGSSYYKHTSPHRVLLIRSLFESVWNQITQATSFHLRYLITNAFTSRILKLRVRCDIFSKSTSLSITSRTNSYLYVHSSTGYGATDIVNLI